MSEKSLPFFYFILREKVNGKVKMKSVSIRDWHNYGVSKYHLLSQSRRIRSIRDNDILEPNYWSMLL